MGLASRLPRFNKPPYSFVSFPLLVLFSPLLNLGVVLSLCCFLNVSSAVINTFLLPFLYSPREKRRFFYLVCNNMDINEELT